MPELDATPLNYEDIMKYTHGEELEVPKYQREYTWKMEMEELLIEDIMNQYESFQSQKTDYFTGSIVIHKEGQEKPRYIVDGQQRITTLTVISCALRDILECTWSIDKFDDNEFKMQASNVIQDVDGSNSPVPIKTIISRLEKLIHKTGADANLAPILKLKQKDQPRLEWIRKSWHQKTVDTKTLCPSTFEWRKEYGSEGLISSGSGGKLADIYQTYFKVWDYFGKKEAGGDEFKQFGILEVEREIFPFDNTGKKIWKTDGTDDKYRKENWQPVKNKTQVEETITAIAKFTHSFSTWCKAIVVTVQDQWQAHLIFDRANTAGKKLAMIDVIRAKLFYRLSKVGGGDADEDDLNDIMEEIYSFNPKSSDTSAFVGHYATMLSGEKISGAMLVKNKYIQEMEKLDNKGKIITWARNFVDAFKLYYEIFIICENKEFPIINTLSSAFKNAKFKQHRPIILKSLICNLDEIEIEKLHKTCESTYVCQMIANNGSPSEIESLMANQIKNIKVGDDATTAINGLIEEYKKTKTFLQGSTTALTKAEFKTKLKIASFNSGQGHFILRNKLYSDIATSTGGLLGNIASTTHLGLMNTYIQKPKSAQLEHILPVKPKSWGSPWHDGNKATKDHEAYHTKIGNMTLINAADNQSVSNKKWAIKKKNYASSTHTQMTQSISGETNWGKTEIDSRTTNLVDFITDRWWCF